MAKFGGIWNPSFENWASQKESEVVKGELKVDQVHIVVSIPPKYSVSQIVGYVKGKSAIHILSQLIDDQKITPQRESGASVLLDRQRHPRWHPDDDHPHTDQESA